MKKLVTAFAACALAGLVNAQVESVNIVGYNTVNLRAGYNLIGLNWEGVGANDGSISVSDLFDNTALTPYDSDSGVFKDYIWVWDNGAGGYTTRYGYVNIEDDPTYKNVWVDVTDGEFTPVVPTIAPNSGFWFYSVSSALTKTATYTAKSF
jgi:hypothetical protein